MHPRSTSFDTVSDRTVPAPSEDWDDGDEGDDEEWEGSRAEFVQGGTSAGGLYGREGAAGLGSRRSSAAGEKGKGKDEPMSPVSVVLYVVFFYLIWQLLTRSTDSEILSHLAPTSPHYHHPLNPPDLPGGSISSQGYHLPYHIPHIPSPLPPSSSSSGEGASTWRLVLGIAMYPLYLVITILATPLPLLLTALHLIASVIGTVLYPFTATARILGRTFLLTPLSWVRAVVSAFYPVYVFVGGVVGVGCVMGVGAGWAGKLCLDFMLGRNRTKSGSKKSSSRSTKRSTSGSGVERSSRSSRKKSAEEHGARVSRVSSRQLSDPGPTPQLVRSKPRSSTSGARNPSFSSGAESNTKLHTPMRAYAPLYPDEADDTRFNGRVRIKGRSESNGELEGVSGVPGLVGGMGTRRSSSTGEDAYGSSGRGKAGRADVAGGWGSSREGQAVSTRRRGVRYADE